MSLLVRETLDLARAHLPAGSGDVTAFAAGLAPVARIGLEYRLGDGSAADVSQLLRPREAGLLADLARERGWPAVLRLADAWRAGLEIDEVWLEQDAGAEGPPSVFLRGAEAERAVALLGVALPAAYGRCREAAERLGANARRIFGVMLSRTGAIRVGVHGLDEPASFLRAIGWPGDPSAAAELFAGFAPLVQRVQLALELAPEPMPQLGLELLLDSRQAGAAAWGPLLDELVGRGLCTPERRAALLAWPGQDAPASADWPQGLIVASLLQPTDRLGAVHRLLSHAKVTIDGARLEAKAYAGLAHEWETHGR